MSDKKILCVGLCVLDIIHVCSEYPREDTDKRCLKGHCQRGGNASNNCTVLSKLGAKCEFLGVLSTSMAFQFLINDLNINEIEINNCPIVEQDPPFSSVILNEKTGTRTIIHSNSNFPIFKYENFKKIHLNEYKWIHFEGRNPEHIIKMMNDIIKYNNLTETNEQIKISVELEKMNSEIIILANYAHYVFLSKDLAIHMGWDDMKTAVYELRKIITNKSCCIICPWSSIGACALNDKDEFFFAEPFSPEKIIDSLGAGDTFCAAVLYALSEQKKSLQRAIEFGNKIAGYKLGFYGYDKIKNYTN